MENSLKCIAHSTDGRLAGNKGPLRAQFGFFALHRRDIPARLVESNGCLRSAATCAFKAAQNQITEFCGTLLFRPTRPHLQLG